MPEVNGETKVLRIHCAVKVLAMSLVIALILSFIAIMIGVAPAPNVPAHALYTSHAPISINGNADFATQATANSWSGDGSPGNPYVIQGYDIDATSAHGILIQNTNVHFIIRDCWVHDGRATDYNGIYLWKSSNNTVSNNTCSNNAFGISPSALGNNTISENNCSNNVYGIYLSAASSSNTISNNNCSNNNIGINLYSSSNNTLSNNICNSNTGDGISLDYSSGNIIDENVCSSNGGSGINLYSSSNNTLSSNNCSYGDRGMRLTSASSNNTLFYNDCSHNVYYGIYVESSNGNALFNNTCENNAYGIYVHTLCNHSTISGNDCSFNDDDGIYLSASSNNTLNNNTCENNNVGFDLAYSSNNNTLSENIIILNGYYGIDAHDLSICNLITGNILINNNGAGSEYVLIHAQASDSSNGNRWNATGTGNYWSDWTSPDISPHDGIVDSPYVLYSGSKDYYPLASPSKYLASPITTISLSGIEGNNGWFISNVSISLSAIDSDDDVNRTFYRIGATGSWLNYTSSFILSDEGFSEIEFYSIDNASNNETVKIANVKIDRTPPTLIINEATGFNVTANYTIISWTGSDATSGLSRYDISIDYRLQFKVGLASSYNFTNLTDGLHNIRIIAHDNASNSNIQEIEFTVRAAEQGGGTSGDLMLYIAIIAIMIIAAMVVMFLMIMRKKRSPPAV